MKNRLPENVYPFIPENCAHHFQIERALDPFFPSEGDWLVRNHSEGRYPRSNSVNKKAN